MDSELLDMLGAFVLFIGVLWIWTGEDKEVVRGALLAVIGLTTLIVNRIRR